MLPIVACSSNKQPPGAVPGGPPPPPPTSMRLMPSSSALALLEANYPGEPSGAVDEVKHIAGLHDQQSFIVAGPPEGYGPMAGLYMGPRARTLTELQAGALVAVIEVDDPTTAAMAPYNRLRLVSAAADQLYCVFLKVTTDDEWFGAVVKATGATCAAPAYDIVVRRNAPSFSAAEYPVAVRFDEDKNGPTIGVPCDIGWCEIADDLAANAQKPIDTDNKYTNRVKGWHDEQRVATKVGGLKPGPSRGSITPIENLASKKNGDFEVMSGDGTYRIGLRVATVMFKGPPPSDVKYTDWQFHNGKSQLWIRKVAANTYEAQFVQGASENKEPNKTGWLGVYFGGKHEKVTVPGVARWIWSPDDEGVWVACDQGCCEISQGFETRRIESLDNRRRFGSH
jgi:hypothetical protein